MPARKKNYIPRPDGEFSAWADQYFSAVYAWWVNRGLDPKDLGELEKRIETWRIAYPLHVSAQAAAESARRSKDEARAALEREIRPVTNFVQSYPGTTAAERAEMGITVRPPRGAPAQTPVTRPLALVESRQRLTHQLRLVDESTPTRRAKPAGVLGAEVWVKLVDADTPAPTDPAALTFLTMTTKPSFRAEFKAGEGGKTAVYMARWVNTRGERGPWSDVTTATVAA